MGRELHAGGTVPAGTWISGVNPGTEAIHGGCFLCSRFRRIHAGGICPEGEKAVPLTKAEDAAILVKPAHAVIYTEP